jgi:hypothetical protein
LVRPVGPALIFGRHPPAKAQCVYLSCRSAYRGQPRPTATQPFKPVISGPFSNQMCGLCQRSEASAPPCSAMEMTPVPHAGAMILPTGGRVSSVLLSLLLLCYWRIHWFRMRWSNRHLCISKYKIYNFLPVGKYGELWQEGHGPLNMLDLLSFQKCQKGISRNSTK